MAKNVTDITWAALPSVTLVAGTGPIVATSDVITFPAIFSKVGLQVAAQHSSTPVNGDYLEFWLELSADGVDYDTEQDSNLFPLGILDLAEAYTNGTSVPAGFTGRKSFTNIPSEFTSAKLHSKIYSPNSGTSVILSAKLVEVT